MELTKIPYKILLPPLDHTFHYIYEPMNILPDSMTRRYGLTVRASAVPEALRERCRIKSARDAQRRPPRPIPILEYDDYIVFGGGIKPEVDWASSVSFSRLDRLHREAQLRNQTPDWIFRQGLSLMIEGHSFEIGQVERYRRGDIPLPPGFTHKTLTHVVTKVTIIGD